MAALFGDNPEYVISAINAFLTDSIVLVNRGALDLLNSHFRISFLNSYMLDFHKILLNSLNILLKRDMSLNRRLFNWLKEIEKCDDWKNIIIQILEGMFRNGISDPEYPYQIMISLLDRTIGQEILPDIFESIVLSTMLHTQDIKKASKVLKSYSLLIDVIDPFFVWKTLVHKLSGCKDANCVMVILS